MPCAVSTNSLLGLKYVPAFFAFMAFMAAFCPALKAIPPGIPILTNAAVIFPAAVASAFSSKVVRSSKNCSTCAA